MMDMSKDERLELLELYKGLRVADVRDGLDWHLMHKVGSMSPSIRPLWRTRAFGIARTYRYVPYDGIVPVMTPDEYTQWVKTYYKELKRPMMEGVEEGDFIVIDQSDVDAGIMGSNNSLGGITKGVRGYVTNGGVRDTDELIIEKVPFWSAFISQTMIQGRVREDSINIPVCVGGVLVNPGDIIVADGDGVVVVPRNKARDVAKIARIQLIKDKEGRRRHYEKLGMPLDETVAD